MSNIAENLYPRSTEYFIADEPEAQAKARESEKANVVKELEVIGGVIERLEERIAFYRSIDAIPDSVLLDPVAAAQTIMGNKKAVAALVSEKEGLVSLVESIRQ